VVFSQPNKSGQPSAPDGAVVEAEVQPGTEGSGGTGANPSGGLPEPRGPIASTLAELRRVVWPSRQQLISESVAVLLMVTLSAAAIASLDRFFRWLSQLVFR
tara:strand:+ start:2521 stop:2826 length:306 start_codon:yes stop_codon:yes gene_type:complete